MTNAKDFNLVMTNAAGAINPAFKAGDLPLIGGGDTYYADFSEAGGLKVGRDFYLAFSPERVDPGRTDFTLRNTPKVVGGLTHACTDRAVDGGLDARGGRGTCRGAR